MTSQIYCFCTITIFCFLGVILRIILVELTVKYEIFTQNSMFLPNSIGSFIMGIVQAEQIQTRYPYLFLGLTVGFCGSLTTFSSWINEILFSQKEKYIAVDIICGILIPLICVYSGRILMSKIIQYYENKQKETVLITKEQANVEVNSKNLELGIIVSISTILIASMIVLFSRWLNLKYLYEILFGPLGAITRYILCLKLNQIIAQFQLGTFLSNLIGTILATILQVTCISEPVCGQIQFGTMGSLSTVSSWANDTINNYQKHRTRAIIYNLSTFCASILSAYIIKEIKVNSD